MHLAGTNFSGFDLLPLAGFYPVGWVCVCVGGGGEFEDAMPQYWKKLTIVVMKIYTHSRHIPLRHS